MACTKYYLNDGRKLVIIQHAVIGPPQLSLVQYCKERAEAGDVKGEIVEGRWYVIPTVERLGEEISEILNKERQVRITVHGDDVITGTEIIDKVEALLKSYGIYKIKQK